MEKIQLWETSSSSTQVGPDYCGVSKRRWGPPSWVEPLVDPHKEVKSQPGLPQTDGPSSPIGMAPGASYPKRHDQFGRGRVSSVLRLAWQEISKSCNLGGNVFGHFSQFFRRLPQNGCLFLSHAQINLGWVMAIAKSETYKAQSQSPVKALFHVWWCWRSASKGSFLFYYVWICLLLSFIIYMYMCVCVCVCLYKNIRIASVCVWVYICIQYIWIYVFIYIHIYESYQEIAH